ncbi:Unknown protein sequence [Pseudomonas syringae pv. cilantro]|uniref:Uncharacterized protein n=1 Tax=Pseudomonas syringae pv. cilantro TaxID=81035 RepID=A0A0N0XEC9_PSESX|nr:Unknown protein sequence [Pseudomonas syringae pv. cilantro]KPW78293.1 hypothetical protein ALO76_102374 [Pseudomonas syringae pv. coriandricola]
MVMNSVTLCLTPELQHNAMPYPYSLHINESAFLSQWH